MKLYAKLALDGMRKNRQLYVPYLLTCGGMVMMSYLMSFLTHDQALESMPFMYSLKTFFSMGYGILAVFAVLFLLYTNSFLMRRRKREFGLYHVLGMGKGALGYILLWETIFTAVVSLTGGLTAGVAFSKLAELGFLNIMQAELNYSLTVPWESLVAPIRTYLPTFLLLYLNDLRQVRFSGALTLLGSEQSGEKPPKANWLLGLGGAILLAAAYYIAAVIADPVTALVWFFIAVIMVIVATYLLMIFGSVLLCRILQKNKRYYYQTNHFISVSSMAYRMKRNGAGLAAVCILATMVLVTLSSTACLYFGMEEAVDERYPREINFEIDVDHAEDLEACAAWVQEDIDRGALEEGVERQNVISWTVYSLVGYLTEDRVAVQDSRWHSFTLDALSHVSQIQFLSLADYNAAMGEQETLEAGEALLYTNREDYDYPTISFEGGQQFTIKRKLDTFLANRQAAMNSIPTMTLVVPNLSAATAGLEELPENPIWFNWYYAFDTGLDEEGQIDYWHRYAPPQSWSAEAERFPGYDITMESRALDRQDFLALYGGLFYLGILLSIVFLFAAVLILYYKQISEGYEDQARFAIMQKVGMTKQEIRRSMNSQLLTVFFLPLLMAGCHLCFAFPMVKKIMTVFNLSNTGLFLITTAVSFAAYAVFYVVVYRITSNAYYHLVSGAKEAA